MRETYVIPAGNLAEFEHQLAQLNKRAKRLGVEPIRFTTSHAFADHAYRDPQTGERCLWRDHEVSRDDDGKFVVGEERQFDGHSFAFGQDEPITLIGVVEPWLHLTVEGETPKFAGWRFIATLSPLTGDEGDTENLVSAVPGEECPAEYRSRIGECDHCNAKRRRRETFVVSHDDGQTKMVGRQCLKDFLGHKNPHSLASMAQLLGELRCLCDGAGDIDGFGGGSRQVSAWNLDHFLSQTAASVRLNGWTSGGAARDTFRTSTKQHVLYLLSPPLVSNHWKEEATKHEPTAEDRERAAAAIAWAETLGGDGEELNDYLYNLSAISRIGIVNYKTAGFAASFLVAHAKAEEREIERKRVASFANEHVGEVGDKLDVAVYVEKIIWVEGHFGTTGIHKFRDAVGRAYTWFASTGELKTGEALWVRGTVKKHDEFKGTLQTVLTRVADRTDEVAKVEAQVASYDAKAKLTKPQQAKRDRLCGEATGAREALKELEAALSW